MNNLPDFPVVPYLPQILTAIQTHDSLILRAEPGAGKTTLVPPCLAEHLSGKILLLEPRRMAARAAAMRIAGLMGEEIGKRCGCVVRGESCVSAQTQIIVMTQGVLLRKLQSDVELTGVDLVIFDEFHERSLDQDLNFTFLADVRANLRPELKLLIMSATLDAGKLKSVLPDAEMLDVPGRTFPIERRFLPESISADRLYPRMAAETRKLCLEREGDALLFLPGVREIDELDKLLTGTLPAEFEICKLHGLIPPREQDRILRGPEPGKRRIILSTNVAESSLTIDSVRIVVDSGLERRSVYSPGAGFSSLETMPISRYSADQRAGRAGRTAPGIALEMATKLEHSFRAESNPPEIAAADLCPAALELANWGTQAEELLWLTPPPPGALAAGQELLRELGALDRENRLTELGKELLRYPLHPRIGKLLHHAREMRLTSLGAEIAGILEERDRFRDFSGAGLGERIAEMRRVPGKFRNQLQIRDQLLDLCREKYRECDVEKTGLLIALAFPDRIGKRRSDHPGSFAFTGGQGGFLAEETDPLRKCEFLAAARLGDNTPAGNRILLAESIAEADIQKYFSHLLAEEEQAVFDEKTMRAIGRKLRKLGNVVLSAAPCRLPAAVSAKLILDEALRRGLPLIPDACPGPRRLLERLDFAHRADPESYPDRETVFSALPDLIGKLHTLDDLRKADWNGVFQTVIPVPLRRKLDAEYPDEFTPPHGKPCKIDYSSDVPTISIRVQNLYSLDRHPVVGRNHLKLKLELLSPAMRPIQTTGDLPGFWRGSWALVRKDMRGRYPKHDWPEHPEKI